MLCACYWWRWLLIFCSDCGGWKTDIQRLASSSSFAPLWSISWQFGAVAGVLPARQFRGTENAGLSRCQWKHHKCMPNNGVLWVIPPVHDQQVYQLQRGDSPWSNMQCLYCWAFQIFWPLNPSWKEFSDLFLLSIGHLDQYCQFLKERDCLSI